MKVKHLGRVPYLETFDAMQAFTAVRTPDSEDEIWFCEHEPVFTQGRHGKAEHLLDAHGIPVVQTDRGGQITYHGPGQLMMYLLLDLKRLNLGPKELVCRLEQALIDTLAHYNIQAERQSGKPGVYVGDAKIAAIGLRIKRGYTYHGISLNLDMDLTPFSYINPCGYANMPVTQISAFYPETSLKQVAQQLLELTQKSVTMPQKSR